ncbi:erythromycin esterase family protein [Prauserella flavalba]|uniref:erythromycin esterase family protein n=1 Tax=Prauserella flavalba TaxID=1477506 RepID=UPI001FE69C0D|nr:erythromycin esterase family protein [Prauserella flavalba]
MLLDRVGEARVPWLAEASHGTHEFYAWRAALTERLVAERGFSFVAVEGDWPDCDRVDACVRRLSGAPGDPRAALGTFERWPTWMWANDEVAEFCRWLRAHNAVLPQGERIGFHGLDVYSLWESLRAILVHLREHDPDAVPTALAAYRCFEPYDQDPGAYARATRFVPENCENEVVDLLVRLRERAAADGPERFRAWQHAEVVAEAERYYRAMIGGRLEAWNIRDRHMAATLDRLLAHYGKGSKAVVWAHNTHVGDARATDMAEAGEVNLGQLARERHGSADTVLVGFGSHHGRVVAARAWGAPTEVLPVPPARPGSLEDVLCDAAPEHAAFVFPDGERSPEVLTDELGHRAIGVVYHPERERWGNYVPTVLGERYDAFLWFAETRGVRPLPMSVGDVLEPVERA